MARRPDPAMIAKPQGGFLRLMDRLAEIARKVERT